MQREARAEGLGTELVQKETECGHAADRQAGQRWASREGEGCGTGWLELE